MIETKTRPPDTPIVEEFTSPKFKNRENQLLFLVRITSFLAILLFLNNSIKIPEYEEILDTLSLALFLGLFGLFLMGLGLSFFQLRYINERRNKITSLGGTIGLFGLFLTGIPCACELGLEALEPPISVFLPYLLGLGLFLTVIGFFTETTQLDEALIYILRSNFISIIRYSVTIVGAFLINYGFLIFFIPPIDETGGLVSIFAGTLFVVGIWIDRIIRLFSTNYIVIIRMGYLSISQILLVLVIAIPIDHIFRTQVLDFDTFLITVIIGVLGLIAIYTDLYYFGVPEQIRGLANRYMPLVQLFVLLCASGLIILGIFYQFFYQNLVETNDLIYVSSFRGFYSGAGFLLLYRMWFKPINNFISRSILVVRTYYKEIYDWDYDYFNYC
ncbi:MAG: hypothetical protein ACXAC2_03800 [Candidatus Kariarchaeaceae archaeon]|jgi:hypothetical protein